MRCFFLFSVLKSLWLFLFVGLCALYINSIVEMCKWRWSYYDVEIQTIFLRQSDGVERALCICCVVWVFSSLSMSLLLCWSSSSSSSSSVLQRAYRFFFSFLYAPHDRSCSCLYILRWAIFSMLQKCLCVCITCALMNAIRFVHTHTPHCVSMYVCTFHIYDEPKALSTE